MSWLSERINALLAERSLRIPEVARDLAIERSQLTQIAAGNRTPNEVLTRRIAAYFGEDPDAWVSNAASTATAVREPPPAPAVQSGFVAAAEASAVPSGSMLTVLQGRAVLANVGGRLFAFDNVCPHAAANLGEGRLCEYIVECPWHNGRWDIRTGVGLTIFATRALPCFEVRLRDGVIEVKLNV